MSINIRAAREAWFYYLSVSINIRAAREAWFYYLSVSINIRAARETWFYYLSVSINIRAAREAWFYYLSVGGVVWFFFLQTFSGNESWQSLAPRRIDAGPVSTVMCCWQSLPSIPTGSAIFCDLQHVGDIYL